MTKRYRLSDMTEATILATRQAGIASSHACIAEAESGAVFVNDLEKYRAIHLAHAEKYRTGAYDHNIHFLQEAIYIQTGESVAILS